MAGIIYCDQNSIIANSIIARRRERDAAAYEAYLQALYNCDSDFAANEAYNVTSQAIDILGAGERDAKAIAAAIDLGVRAAVVAVIKVHVAKMQAKMPPRKMQRREEPDRPLDKLIASRTYSRTHVGEKPPEQGAHAYQRRQEPASFLTEDKKLRRAKFADIRVVTRGGFKYIDHNERNERNERKARKAPPPSTSKKVSKLKPPSVARDDRRRKAQLISD